MVVEAARKIACILSASSTMSPSDCEEQCVFQPLCCRQFR
jgi:hypothetical protein